MKKVSIKEFAKEKGFNKLFPKVRINVHDYLYVTFMMEVEGGDAVCENIYLSQGASEEFKAGDDFISRASQYEIGYTTNADGEERIKVCRKGESAYVSIDDIL